MKNTRIFLIGILMLLACVTVNGQTEKGKILIGGSSNLNFTSLNSKWKENGSKGDNNEGSSAIKIAPQAGYFIANNFALGIELPLEYSKKKADTGSKIFSTTLTAAPFARYYFGEKDIKPYLHSSIGWGFNKRRSEYESYNGPATNKLKYHTFLYGIGGGVSFFLNEKTALDIGVSYLSLSRKEIADFNTSNYRIINAGIGLGIGFIIFL